MVDSQVLKRARKWLKKPFDDATQEEVRQMIERDPKALSDAFFKDLSFGTGGMRGLMGAGTSRLNVYTIRAATLGLAHAILKQPMPPEGYSVFIGYDVRHHSREFAETAARTLAAKNIRAFLTRDICPTPLVSFGVRHFQCSAGIMITASHNPPAYNGYKVYWNDGGQVVHPHDEAIIDEVRKVEIDREIPQALLESPLIIPVGRELDRSYLEALKPLQLYPGLDNSSIKILYTPLHGTGVRIIPEALKSWGFSQVRLLNEQKTPDGNFTNAPSPNPEEKKALELGTAHLMKEKEDILIATDPDADRMGVVVLDKGKPSALTGNQIACIALHHICSALTTRGEFPPNAAFIKTIVTTELFRKIAEGFGGICIDVLTGFKYIAEKMTLWQNSFDAYQYLFGAEESYGYLFGTLVRDKDAIGAACLLSEAVSLGKKQNLTLIDRLYQIYQRFGLYREGLINLAFEESEAGMNQMKDLMETLRKATPSAIGGTPIIRIEDYLTSVAKDLPQLREERLDLPRSDVLRFWLEDGSKLVIRPSGTEPKVKIYGEVVQKEVKDVDRDLASCDERLKFLMETFRRDVS